MRPLPLPLGYRGRVAVPQVLIVVPDALGARTLGGILPLMTGCRVVVGEDEALIRLDLVEMLQEFGHEVVGQAADGERAVQLARELLPDLILLDVRMPILDGISAAEVLAAEGIAPVVLLTAFSQSDLVERALAAGVQGYVVKPFSAADLGPAIAVARSRFAEVVALRENLVGLSDRLESRKLVDRAKAKLQGLFAWDEQQAFEWLQRAAMDRRVSMAEVAQGVLRQPPHSNGN